MCDFDVARSCDVISPDHFGRGFYYSSFRRCGLNFLVLQKDNKILVYNQRKDQLVSLTLCFTTQQVERQREDKIKGNETMAYHHGGEGGKDWLNAKVLRVALREDEKRKNEKMKK